MSQVETFRVVSDYQPAGDQPKAIAALVDGITVLTDEPDKDYGLWGLSLSYQGPHSISGFVDYQSVTGMSGMTLSEITVGLRIQKQFD